MAHAIELGLLSDTHIPHRMAELPGSVLEALRGVDVVLHAGDVDDPKALAPLRAIAPVHAVRGNIHLQDFSDGGSALPAVVEMSLAGQRIVLTHGHHPGLPGFAIKGRDIVLQLLRAVSADYINEYTIRYLVGRFPAADIIVFGHTHRSVVRRVGSMLLVNPGAVSPTRHQTRSVARLRLGNATPTVEVVPLE
jgi:putative phosphoesterase